MRKGRSVIISCDLRHSVAKDDLELGEFNYACFVESELCHIGSTVPIKSPGRGVNVLAVYVVADLVKIEVYDEGNVDKTRILGCKNLSVGSKAETFPSAVLATENAVFAPPHLSLIETEASSDAL